MNANAGTATVQPDDTRPRAIVYARFSPQRKQLDENGEDSKKKTITMQVGICSDYCSSKGYDVVAIHEDQHRSGADENRPGLHDALAELKTGDVLVVWRNDRLARGVFLSEWLRREVKKKGASIEAVDSVNDDDTPESIMVRQIVDVVSQFERASIAAKTRRALLAYQRQGRRISRYAPYGWAIDPDNAKMLVEVEAEQQVIKIMLRMRGEGLCFREIARELDELSVPTRGRGKWRHQTVSGVLRRLDAL